MCLSPKNWLKMNAFFVQSSKTEEEDGAEKRSL